MAYLYFSDGSPDAEEYESNYLYFNEANTAVVMEIERLLVRKNEDPTVINQLEALCRKSFEVTTTRSNAFSKLKTTVDFYCKKMSNSISGKRPRSLPMKTVLSH